MPRARVLTYHSQNIAGSRADNNDHVALASDLETLHGHGFRIVSLTDLLDWLDGTRQWLSDRDYVCLTFDDGCDYDVADLEWPGLGVQQGFLGILQDFVDRNGSAAQPALEATSFVIASAEARRVIDRHSLHGEGRISDDWWRMAVAHPLLSLGNHGWDHNHPDLDPGDPARGGFSKIDTAEQCVQQVIESARCIEALSGRWPEFFAYPFGESSPYLRERFFPDARTGHGCRAAFGTRPGPVTLGSDRWDLPRYVCGRDWHDAESLLELLKAE